MASIRCRPETGTLFLDFRVGGVRYREQTDLRDTPGNRKMLQKKLNRLEAELEEGSFDPSSFSSGSLLTKRFTVDRESPRPLIRRPVDTRTVPEENPARQSIPRFGDFAEQFFRELAVGWRANTCDWMRWLLDTHLLPSFRDRYLDAITREEVLNFRVHLAERRSRSGRSLSPKSINVVMRVLKAIMTEAADRYGLKNPLAGIKPLKVRKHDVQPFTLDEVQRILQSVRPDFRHYLTVAFFTGMRPGELNGLKW